MVWFSNRFYLKDRRPADRNDPQASFYVCLLLELPPSSLRI